MFRILPWNTVSVSNGAMAGRWSTGAEAAIATPGTGRRLRKAEISKTAPPDWDLIHDRAWLESNGARILHLFGEVMDFDGCNVGGAQVEIWQNGPSGPADQHRGSDRAAQAFRGSGTIVTDSLGQFLFRTILPVPVDGRAPHINTRVTQPSGKVLETEIYIVDAPENDRDWQFCALGPSQQAALSIDPVRRPDGDLEAGFNFVV